MRGWDKAQEWCKPCGGLWEGWKRGDSLVRGVG